LGFTLDTGFFLGLPLPFQFFRFDGFSFFHLITCAFGLTESPQKLGGIELESSPWTANRSWSDDE
jgi:hypothetical protein